MFRRSFDSCCCSALLIALLPLAILGALRAKLLLRRPGQTRRRSPARATAAPLRPIGEFDFHRALSAYEELIDEVIEDSAA